MTNKILRAAATLALLPLSCGIAFAEGYQVNTVSARQLGMGHTGVSLKLGSESQYFNPAAVAFMNGFVDASVSVTAISPEATATYKGNKFTTDNEVSTPFSIFGSIRISDKMKAGVSLYNPAGSSINWTNNWPGSTLAQSVKLQSFTFQPTFAWKILPFLSAGAGITMTWGNVDLHKGLISGAQLDGMLAMTGQPASFGNITPASVMLKGDAGVAWGANLGLMADVSRNITLGASFRTKSMLKVKAGITEVEYAVSDPQVLALLSSKLGGISKAEFSAEMPSPAALSFGGNWHNGKFTAALEAQLTFWSAYKSLDITFAGVPQFNQHLEKNYHDAWLLKGGAEWNALPRLDLRAGLTVDFTPCDKLYYNPETPGMTKIEPTLGLTFRPLPCLDVNASFMYIAGCGIKNASYTSTNPLTGASETFTADYKLHALVGSLGFSLNF